MVEDFGWEMRSRRQETAPLARSSQGCLRFDPLGPTLKTIFSHLTLDFIGFEPCVDNLF